ncbi:MAG: hypothetical protein ACE5GD_00085 [Candidatus Geothermarchaeales archaeon]
MPLTGERFGDYLVDTAPKVVVVGEEARLLLHIGNIKTGKTAPSDLDIVVEFLDPDTGVVLGSYETVPWTEVPAGRAIAGFEIGDYLMLEGYVFDKPGRYPIRVKMLGQEAEYDIKVVEEFKGGFSIDPMIVGIIIVVVIALIAVVYLRRR